jgi:glutathione S-transferase
MSRGRIARWMLEEVGAEYETVVVDFGGDERLLPINPMGKVPTIVHRGRTITECAAICAYLADAYPEAQLAPSIGDRSDYYRWLFFAAGPLEQAVVSNSLGWKLRKSSRLWSASEPTSARSTRSSRRSSQRGTAGWRVIGSRPRTFTLARI